MPRLHAGECASPYRCSSKVLGAQEHVNWLLGWLCRQALVCERAVFVKRLVHLIIAQIDVRDVLGFAASISTAPVPEFGAMFDSV